MKKQYIKPSTKVIDLKQRQVLLCGSGNEKGRKSPCDYDDEFAYMPRFTPDENHLG